VTCGDYRLVEGNPSKEDYQRLRAAVGWSPFEPEATERGLRNDLFGVTLLHGADVVGCGRIVGDGAVYFYLQDIIVLPEHQKRGLGALIMDAVMAFIEREAAPGSFVGLMAAVGVEGFYERYGFRRRSDQQPGMGLRWGAPPDEPFPQG
jgi:GNAT superfamily N-acetyltransferase